MLAVDPYVIERLLHLGEDRVDRVALLVEGRYHLGVYLFDVFGGLFVDGLLGLLLPFPPCAVDTSIKGAVVERCDGVTGDLRNRSGCSAASASISVCSTPIAAVHLSGTTLGVLQRC